MDNFSPAFKTRLGIFLVFGLVIFMIIIFFVGKQQNLFNPVFQITTDFQNVSGLLVGKNVRYSGINVGIVDNIAIINDSTVQVSFFVRRNVQEFIKADSKASIGSEGIIGDRVLVITQGTSGAPTVRDGQHIASQEPVETDEIMQSLQASAYSAQIITNQLSEILTFVNSGEGSVGRMIFDETIADNMAQTIDNFKKSSEDFDEIIEVTQQNVYTFMEKLQETAAKTEIASQQLGEIMTRINSGEGTIGALINDTTMAANLGETLENLRSSSQGLDENMEALKHNFFFRRYFRRLERQRIKDEKQRLIELREEQAAEAGPEPA
ncbi:MAG: MlaD family protein [Candidatus Cyclonatronum sp.]|uniref:MlaD family protein n=1 Tax=Cyclonatronum sp. TaxID=3024185 RepID=UPI0025BABA87|nr:MlaD family protein [Cyclonatronum sp.]MCH8487556.1 MlaD family protein [Cyclonatronum sp.]